MFVTLGLCTSAFVCVFPCVYGSVCSSGRGGEPRTDGTKMPVSVLLCVCEDSLAICLWVGRCTRGLFRVGGCGSVVELLLSMCEALDSILSTGGGGTIFLVLFFLFGLVEWTLL